MFRSEVITIDHGTYDFALCVGTEELKQTIHHINQYGWRIVAVTQSGDVYTVFFRRPVNG